MTVLKSSLVSLGSDQFVQNDRGRPILAVRETLGWTRPVFARLCTISERQLAEIERKRTASQPTIRRLTELHRIVEALGEVMDEESIGNWLLQPNPAFDNLKPLEVIERGQTDRIWQTIFFLKSGVAS
jgi:transcriptional regulator with XRE-family HTH domain